MDRGDLDRLLSLLAQRKGSDLHIKAGAQPKMRLHGDLVALKKEEAFSAQDTEQLAFAIMPPRAAEEFVTRHETDFAYSVEGAGRFRCNAFLQRGSTGIV